MTRRVSRQEPAPPGGAPDAVAVLRELATRWAGARTLEYRSTAVLNHAGEFRIEVRIHARLCRPSLARVLFVADNPEVSRLRVCDGRRLCDRSADTPTRPGRTIQMGFAGRLLADLPHPLDETAYCVDQFFARTPFRPPPGWANGARPKLTAERAREAGRAVIRLVFDGGPAARDTVTLDASSYAPIEVTRVGDHAGRVQELLRERFESVRLGADLPASLFRWTAADDEGRTLRP